MVIIINFVEKRVNGAEARLHRGGAITADAFFRRNRGELLVFSVLVAGKFELVFVMVRSRSLISIQKF
jgi:hypothetical protein